MRRRVEMGPYIIEVDVLRTKEYYQTLSLMTNSCSCDACKNFVKACSQFPPKVITFFQFLGIDPRKEGEVYVLEDSDKPIQVYYGFYHVVGTIIKGSVNENLTKLNVPSPYQLSVAFTNELDLVPDDFSKPAFQLDFEMSVPWLLN